ncbi:MAG: choice-of-anchor J domain-containing protein [Bacteroidales bacterium]|nr:choice-of-anchor J domain-containing protein [Bacteroidales bacterium]
MKKILLTALALLMGTFMYAQRDAAKVPGVTPSKDVKTEAVLSAVKAPANVNSTRTTKGDSELTYCTADFNGSIGTGGTGSYYEWAAVFRPSMYTADDNYITSVDFYSYQAATYTVSIYEGEAAAAVPTTVIYQHQYNVTGANQWVTLPIVNSVVAIDKTKALWVAVGTDQVGYPACYSNEVLTTTDCCMMYFQNEWLAVNELGSFDLAPWMIVANTTSDEPAITCETISTFPYFNDFEDFTTNHDCWVSIDNDGDGNDWLTGTSEGWSSNLGVESSHCILSRSYKSGTGALHADNYILTPEFELPAGATITLSWMAASQDPQWPDTYEVLVAPNGSTEISDFVLLFTDTPDNSNAYAFLERSLDLSDYAGTTVRVVFRHHDYDQFYIKIDNLGIETAFDCSSYGYPFVESFENGLDCWGNFDEDGDGHIWELAAGNTGNGAKSVSWSGTTSSLYPDNWLVSPEITIPSGLDEVTLAWKVKGGSTSYREHYGVYVSTTGDQPADFTTQVYEGQSPSSKVASSWSSVTVDMTAYVGQTVRIAFRHYNSDDNWDFTIDDISIKSPLPCNDITEFPYFNDFENFLDEKHCWIDIDNDGDGYGWFTDTEAYGTAGFGVDGSNCIVSQSYDNSTGSRDADNYLLSPEVVFPANSTITLSWFEQSLDGNYPDSYEVMIAPNGSTEISDFVSIYSGVAENPWTERTADISAYAGTTVRVVFHHESSDCYILEIDNMSITLGGSPEPDECAITTFPYFNDFENFASEVECWVSIDNDGDGEDWLTGTAQSGMFNGYNYSSGLVSKSYNYDDEAGVGTDLDADNYLVSPEFVLPANGTVTLSWYAMSTGGENWPDYYEVMIAPNGSTEISDFVSVLGEDAPIDWEERTADISAYAGTTVRVVFHHQDFAQYWVIIDNLGVTVEGGGDPEPDECAITTFPYFNDFENFASEVECWVSIDNDGDGEDWLTGTAQSGMFNGYNYSSGLVSKSYNYDDEAGVGTDLDADNYLVSPEFVLPANGTVTLSWYAMSTGGENWPDYYEVMIAPNGSTEISDFVSVLGEDAPIDWEERTADISAYAGTTVRVVFHHQDFAQYWVVLDNFGVTVEGGGDPEPGNYPYLETFDVNGMDDWSNLDEDGDGHIWELAAGYTGQGAKSVSWQSASGKPSFDPDNWLISPEVTIPATAGQEGPVQLSWYVQSGSNSYPEHYGVYVSTTGDQPADFTTQLYEGTSPSTNWTQLSVDLNAYIGQTIRVAFRHYDSYDKWHFTIDNIEIKEYEEPEPVECDPITTFPYFNDFEDFLTNHDCWIDIDNDGDGQTWLTGTTNYGTMGWGVNASNCLVSQSYDNNVGAYNADNYLVSPEFELPTTVEEALILSWFEQSQDASYPDSYEVMIAPNGSTEISDFVSIYSGVAANPWTERTFDISSYAGQTIRVVFHHQSSDCYMLEIDNMSIYDGQGPEPVECDPITDFPYFNDFENFLAEKDCWIDIDNDGDGQTWFTGTTNYWGSGFGVDGSNCLVSQSYDNYVGAFDADNYLVSPEFVLPAGEDIKLSWYAQAQDPDYPDSYEVMIAPNGSTNVSDFVSVYGEVSTNPWAERYVDISAYAGTTIRVVFHHQDYDNYFVEIDNMGIEVYTGVNEDNDTEFAVYPNPVKNTMTLTGVEVGTEVRIYDLAGNTVMSFVYEGQIVNVENLANGVYVLRANDNMVKIVK